MLSLRDAFEHISSGHSDNITEGAAELPKFIETPAVKSDTLMAATVEDLYRNYGILADAKEDLSTVNKASYIYAIAQ